ncbi:fibropellin-1 [Biomphalaria glabrata]|nr:fibropellin-1 [Biomphalaria glabrata]
MMLTLGILSVFIISVLLLAQMRSAQSQIGPCDKVNYLYRHPGDCYKFLACTTYGAVPMDCPANLVFYEREQRCDYKYLVPECRDNGDPNPCYQNRCYRGSCQIDSTKSSGYTCVCEQGFTGTDCSIDIDECSSSPCLNGGACTNLPGNYSCTCYNGYSGPRCEIPPCSTSTCIQGYCSSATQCTCYSGYTGVKCDTAPCPVYPCPVDVPSYSYPSWEDLNCQSYYNCNRGSLVKRTCPFGQKFDVVTLACQNQNEPDRFFCDIFIGSPV